MSGLLLLYTPRHWLLHAFLHEGTTFLFLAACQSCNCRLFLCLKSFQFKLQKPSNRHWLEVSFWYGAAFSSEIAVPVALAYCTCCGETPPCCYQVRHTSYALSFISVRYSLMWVSLQVAVGVKFEQCMQPREEPPALIRKGLNSCFLCVPARQHHLLVSKGSTGLMPSGWISQGLLKNNPA